LINEKIYIGQSINNNKNYLGSGKYIKRAIKKYGRENFKRDIIEDGITDRKILSEREIYWISFYDSTDPKIGYNIAKGGEVIEGPLKKGSTYEETYGRDRSDKIKQSISIKNTGKINSEETRKKISTGRKGKLASEDTRSKMSKSRLGIKLSEETIRKMSASKTGIKRPDQSKFMEENNPMQGKHHTSETKEKISSRKKENKNKGGQGIKTSKNNGSVYVGVYRTQNGKKWLALISCNCKSYHLGTFDREEDAADAYNKKAIELYGNKARLNVIK
jgi:hypothetical protein